MNVSELSLRECDEVLERIIRETRDTYTIADVCGLWETRHVAPLLADGHIIGWEDMA